MLTNLCEIISADDRQVPVPPKATLEVGFHANPARVLDPGYRCRRSVILLLVFRRDTGGLLRIVDEVGKQLEACCRGRKRHRIPIGDRQRVPAVIQIGMQGTCLNSSNTRPSITPKSTSV